MSSQFEVVILSWPQIEERSDLASFDCCVSISDFPGISRPRGLYRKIPYTLMLDFDDDERDTHFGPKRRHAVALNRWLHNGLVRNHAGGRWLFHCHAGVSRSTAAALVLLAMKYGYDNSSLASRLLAIRSCSMPNRLLVALCEDVLQLSGRPLSAQAQSCLPDDFPLLTFPKVPDDRNV